MLTQLLFLDIMKNKRMNVALFIALSFAITLAAGTTAASVKDGSGWYKLLHSGLQKILQKIVQYFNSEESLSSSGWIKKDTIPRSTTPSPNHVCKQNTRLSLDRLCR